MILTYKDKSFKITNAQMQHLNQFINPPVVPSDDVTCVITNESPQLEKWLKTNGTLL